MSEAATSRLDSLKWVVVLVLVAGGIFGNSYYGDQPILYRVLALLVWPCWLAGSHLSRRKAVIFLRWSRARVTKFARSCGPRVRRPRKRHDCFVFVIVTGLILWGLDSVLGWLASLILG